MSRTRITDSYLRALGLGRTDPRLTFLLVDKSEPSGLTHRITLVDLEGERYLVDGGFGPWGPRRPIGLSQAAVREPGRAFRVTESQAGVVTTGSSNRKAAAAGPSVMRGRCVPCSVTISASPSARPRAGHSSRDCAWTRCPLRNTVFGPELAGLDRESWKDQFSRQ